MGYEIIDTVGEIERLRPKTFDNARTYLVRLHPEIRLKSWAIPNRRIVLQRQKAWVSLGGREARIVSLYSENGRSTKAEWSRAIRVRYLRPMCDIVASPEDATRVEQLYELGRSQSVPGTPQRPHAWGSQKNQNGPDPILDRIEEQLDIPVDDVAGAELNREVFGAVAPTGLMSVGTKTDPLDAIEMAAFGEVTEAAPVPTKPTSTKKKLGRPRGRPRKDSKPASDA